MSANSGKVLNGSLVRVAYLILSIIIALYLMPFLIGSLGEASYGIWIIIGQLSVYYGLLDLGFSSAVTRFFSHALVRDDRNECNAIFVTSLVLLSAVGLIALLVTGAVVCSVRYFVESPRDISVCRIALLLLGLDLALSFPFSVYRGVVLSNLRIAQHCLVEICHLVFRTGMILVIVRPESTIVTLAAIGIVANQAANLVFWAMARRLCPWLSLRSRFLSISSLKSFASFSLFAFTARIADRLRFNMDYFVIGSFLGAPVVAHYSIATRFATYFTSVVGAAVGALTPVFTQIHAVKQEHWLLLKYLQATRFSVLISTTLAGGIVVFAEPFIGLWLDRSFLDAWSALIVLICGMFLCGCQAPSINVLYALAKNKAFACVTLLEGIANLLLSLILVRNYGMLGVALGTTIPIVLTKLVFQPIYTCRQLNYSVWKYHREVLRVLTPAALLQVPIYFYVRSIECSDYVTLISVAGWSYILYGVVVLLFALPREDRILLWSIISRGSRKMAHSPGTR